MSTDASPAIEATCTRHLPYTVHEMHSARGNICRRAAVAKDKDGRDICAVHRGADVRGEQIRQRSKDRYYRRLGIDQKTGKKLTTKD
ncbi:hypothetical protein IV500_04760 [Paeniglutamicibacter antarcticus]|uniref:Uncharacterized protein n=1 Tax=Arthrobacter terrae TaxID=2935737 RepID=A0A931CPQ1_9MICC|nr:hypothetical protein [Arthrobacter terrae]MBG0738729.1 hypothetical protein [Arthrobacter terrae]